MCRRLDHLKMRDLLRHLHHQGHDCCGAIPCGYKTRKKHVWLEFSNIDMLGPIFKSDAVLSSTSFIFCGNYRIEALFPSSLHVQNASTCKVSKKLGDLGISTSAISQSYGCTHCIRNGFPPLVRVSENVSQSPHFMAIWV
jgi:hypothetical protein